MYFVYFTAVAVVIERTAGIMSISSRPSAILIFVVFIVIDLLRCHSRDMIIMHVVCMLVTLLLLFESGIYIPCTS